MGKLNSIVFLYLAYCCISQGSSRTLPEAQKIKDDDRRVIIDLDMGLDDYLAVLVLMYAEQLGQLKIEAITCASGNTNITNVVRNTLRLLNVTNRPDIPVYQGSFQSLILHEKLVDYDGSDGFGDLDYGNNTNVLPNVQSGLASAAIYDLLVNNPNKISLISLAPLTNIALTLKLYNNFASNLKDIWILGGNYEKIEQSGATTEFNFLYDSEAAHIVFESMTSPIYFMPWETALKVTIPYNWLFDILGGHTPAMELLIRAETAVNHSATEDYWIPSDAFLAFAFVNPDQHVTNLSMHNVEIELRDTEKIGWVLLDTTDNPRNVTLIEAIDQNKLQEFLLEVGSNV